MWKELKPKPRILPPWIITVSSKGGFRFGAETVRMWELDKFHSIKILQDSRSPLLIGIQLFTKEKEGRIPFLKGDSTMEFSARWLMKDLGILPGRYYARKRQENNFITVDFANRLTEKDIEVLAEKIEDKRWQNEKKKRGGKQ